MHFQPTPIQRFSACSNRSTGSRNPTRQKDRVSTRHPDGHAGPTLQGDKYREMRRAILKALSCDQRGLELSSLIEAVRPLLSEQIYDSGSLTPWYCVNVKLDLEARGEIECILEVAPERYRHAGDA